MRSILFLIPAIALSAQAAETIQLQTDDGVNVVGSWYRAGASDAAKRPLLLLFHQAGSNRAEYAPIAARLSAAGFDALAVDQRSGGRRFGSDNETVKRLGRSTSYLEALPDLEAALAWAHAHYDGKPVAIGSSYSAALVFLLAARHPNRLAGIIAFSPGEYLGTRSREVRTAAARIALPVRIFAPKSEQARAQSIFAALPDDYGKLIIPDYAVHGASMLREDLNPGAGAIWPEFLGALSELTASPH